jgi:voltage-dependent potassium channel beta subunit
MVVRMQYRHLGRSGLRVSSLGLGTWLTFGRSLSDEDAESLVHVALDAGINLIDTADSYESGACEEALARALVGVERGRYVLATKCFFPVGDGPNDRGLSRKHIFESVDASLRRLRTSYLDILQCHRFDPDTPLEETVRAFDDLIRQGKLLYWGMSRWTARQLEEVCELCEAGGWHRPIVHQPCYNLLERDIEDEILPVCEGLGISQIVYSPLAQGVLTGKYLPGEDAPEGSRVHGGAEKTHIDRFLGEAELSSSQRFAELARSRGYEPPQLALAWCLRQPNVASVLLGASRIEQLEQNLGALAVTIDAELEAQLDSV